MKQLDVVRPAAETMVDIVKFQNVVIANSL